MGVIPERSHAKSASINLPESTRTTLLVYLMSPTALVPVELTWNNVTFSWPGSSVLTSAGCVWFRYMALRQKGHENAIKQLLDGRERDYLLNC